MSNGITRRRGSIDIVDAKVAVDLATAQSYKENVFLFTPNLIGVCYSLTSKLNSYKNEYLNTIVDQAILALYSQELPFTS